MGHGFHPAFELRPFRVSRRHAKVFRVNVLGNYLFIPYDRIERETEGAR